MKIVVLERGDGKKYTEQSIYENFPSIYTRESLFKTEYYKLYVIEENTAYYKFEVEFGDEAHYASYKK